MSRELELLRFGPGAHPGPSAMDSGVVSVRRYYLSFKGISQKKKRYYSGKAK